MKKIYISILLMAVCSLAYAQALPSLLVNSDPVTMGAGGTSTLGSNLHPLQNYAAAAALEDYKLSAGLGWCSWQPDAGSQKMLAGAASYKISEKLFVALDYKSFKYPSYKTVNNSGTTSQTVSSFSPKESAVALGAGYAIMPGLSAAITLRMASSALSKDAKASAFGMDLSAAYAKDNLRAALAICNLGGKVNFGEGDYKQPALLKAGASYEALEGLKAGAELTYLFEGAFAASLGAEYCWKDIVSARAGYHYGAKDLGIPSYASVGLGAKYFGVQFNAAYLLASETLGGSLLIGLGYSF